MASPSVSGKSGQNKSGSSGASPQDYDRSGGRGQHLFLQFGADAVTAGDFKVAHHDGDGFVEHVFTSPQLRHGVAVERIAESDEAVVSFDGDNSAFLNFVAGRFERRIGVGNFPGAGHEQSAGTADGAGLVRVSGMLRLLLLRALFAGRKRHERGVAAVERSHCGDGISRSAVPARDKRIVIETRFGVKHFADAIGTRRLIRLHAVAGDGGTEQFERSGAFGRIGRRNIPLNQTDCGQVKRARKFDGEGAEEFRDDVLLAGEPEPGPVRGGRDPSAEFCLDRHFPDERAERRSVHIPFQINCYDPAHSRTCHGCSYPQQCSAKIQSFQC